VIIKDTNKAQISNMKVDGNDINVVPAYGENSEVTGVELQKKRGGE
jgi:hypothetical protein